MVFLKNMHIHNIYILIDKGLKFRHNIECIKLEYKKEDIQTQAKR